MEEVREKLRNEKSESRRKIHEISLDKVRELSDDAIGPPLTEESERFKTIFQEKVRKLSKKSIVTYELLQSISRSLLTEDGAMITAFLEVDQGLPNLIRIFYYSNCDADIRVAASHCLCNLSLGDEWCCKKVAKTAGAQLVMRLDSLNFDMVEISAWTIGNLSHYRSAADILKNQGAYSHVIKLLQKSDNIQKAAIKCLAQAIHRHPSLFTSAEYTSIAKSLLPHAKTMLDAFNLLALMSFHDEVLNLFKEIDLFGYCLNWLIKTIPFEADQNADRILSIIRILANAVCEKSGENALRFLQFRGSIEITAKRLLECPYSCMRKETFWLLGNLLNHESEQVRALCEKLRVDSWESPKVINYMYSPSENQTDRDVNVGVEVMES